MILPRLPLKSLEARDSRLARASERDVSLPLQLTLALVDNGSQLGVFVHVGLEGLVNLQLVGGGRHLATGQRESLLVVIGSGILAKDGGLTQVGGEADHVEVLVDVVHDLGLKEGLGSVIHDLVGKLGLGNVLSQLLDTSATSLGGTIFVDNFLALPLGGLTVGKLSNELFDDFELTTEKRILAHVHLVSVHLQEIKVDTGNGFNQALVRGGQLELSEQTGGNAASGRPGQTNLAVNNDGAVNCRALQGLAKVVEVALSGGGRVAHGDSHVNKAGELFLQALNDGGQSLQLLDLQLRLLLVDINNLQLVAVALSTALQNSEEFLFVLLHGVTGDVTELSILTDLVGGSGADGAAVHINNRLLAHVKPDDLIGLGVEVTASLVDGIFESSQGGLAAAVDLVARHTTEVGDALNDILQLLDLFKVILHGSSLPDFRIVSHVWCFDVRAPL